MQQLHSCGLRESSKSQELLEESEPARPSGADVLVLLWGETFQSVSAVQTSAKSRCLGLSKLDFGSKPARVQQRPSGARAFGERGSQSDSSQSDSKTTPTQS